MKQDRNAMKAIATVLGVCGLCILIAGVLLLIFLNQATPSVKLHIGVGGVLFLIGLLANYHAIFKYVTGSKGKLVFISITMISLNIYILVCFNYISFNHRVRIDLTKTKRFTISDKTKNILKSKVKSNLYFVINEAIDPESLSDLNELINQFTYNCDFIKVKRFNPLKNPSQAASLQKSFQIKPDHLLIVASETKGTGIDKGPLLAAENNRISWFKGEQAILNALLNTISNKRVKITFLTGHGEPSIDETNKQKSNLSQLKNWLTTENYIVEEKSLSISNEEIPEDCDVLVIVGPEKTIPPDHVNQIKSYLNKTNKNGRKGCLIFANGPQFESAAGKLQWLDSGLENLLQEKGIILDNNILIEKDHYVKSLGIFSLYITPQSMSDHPITNPARTAGIAMEWNDRTRSINALNRSQNVIPLLASTVDCKAVNDVNGLTASLQNKSFGQFLSEREAKQYITAACSVEFNKDASGKSRFNIENYDNNGTKIVVFGSHGFLVSPIKDNARDLFVNSIKWLTQDSESIGRGPEISDKVSWTIPAEKEWYYREIIFYLMPLFWVLVGSMVWWYRKG